MNNCYRLMDIPKALKQNHENYIEFIGKDSAFKKQFNEIYIDLMKTMTYFRRIGLSQGDRIGIIGSNSYEFMLVDLAAAVVGYVSVPFTEKDFCGKIKELQSEFDLAILFVDEKYDKVYCNEKIYPLYQLRTNIEKEECYKEEDLPALDDESDFAVIFTSGTTGTPKGITIRVKCVDEWIQNIVDAFDFNKEDKLLNFLSLSISNARLFVYASILIPYNMTLTNPELLAKASLMSKPTILQGVPHLFESFYWSVLNEVKKSKKLSFQYFIYRMCKHILPRTLLQPLVQEISIKLKRYFGGNVRIMVTGSAPISINVLQFYEDMGLKLYEAYGINEVGLVSINNQYNYRVGSVGKPFSTKTIKFSPQQEVLIQSDYIWARSYLNDTKNLGEAVFKKDGYVATGDIGHMDKDGFLYIDGRLKEIICLSSGNKIHPSIIEDEIKKSGLIKQVVAFGNAREFITCVLVPLDQQISREKIQEAIQKTNKALPEQFAIMKFVLSDEPFTVQNGLMNITLKINRSAVYEKYKKQIELFYN